MPDEIAILQTSINGWQNTFTTEYYSRYFKIILTSTMDGLWAAIRLIVDKSIVRSLNQRLMYCIETINLIHKFSEDETALNCVNLQVIESTIYGF